MLLTKVEGSAPLVPRFAPPVAAYLCPGLTLPVEVRRKVDQLSSAGLIVAMVPPDWEGFAFWPELAAALDGCEPVLAGETFRVYRRVRPASPPSHRRDHADETAAPGLRPSTADRK